MKRKYAVLLGMIVAFAIFLGFKLPAQASAYKAQIILDSYEVADNYKIGEDTSIKVVFRNTDASYFIRNLLINCSSNSNTVVPVEGKSNQLYVDAIRPNETVEVEIPIVITHSESGYASMIFNMEYMSDDTRWSASSYIVFPVKEDGSAVVIKNVNVPAEATQNTSVLCSAYFLNSLERDMFNTEFVVNGEIAGGEKSSSLGSILSKRNAYGENYVSFSESGSKMVTLSIRYEDVNGESHEDVIGQYTIEVKAASQLDSSISNGSDSTSEITPSRPLSVSTILLIVSGVIVLIIFVVVAINIMRKRK